MSLVIQGTKEGADGLSEFTKKLEKLKGASDAFDGMGFAAAKATAVNDTLFGTLTRLSSAWSDLKTNIGDAFKEDFRKFIETITQLVTTISKFVTENPKLVAAIQKVITVFIAYKAVAIGSKFMFGASIATLGALQKAGVGVWKALAGAGSEAGGFFRIFKLLTSPVFWLIAGLAALAVAIYLVYTHWDDLGAYVKEHWALFATLATLIGVGLVAAFYGAASAAWSFTIALLANPITWIILLIAALVGAIMYLYYNWDDVCYEWRVNWEQFKHVCKLAIDEIVAYFQPLIDSFYAVKDAMSALFSGDFKGAFDAIAADKYIMQTGQTVRGNWNSRFGGASAGATSANIGGHKFATGGFFDRPTLGIFGEAGPEWIIPADGSQRTLGLLADAAAANGISLGGGVGVVGGGVKADFALGDIEPLPAGELFMTKGSDLVLQDIWLRLTTPRGDLWSHPGYGVDIYRYLHSESTLANRMSLCQLIKEEIRKDPRVRPESVSVKVKTWNARTHALTLDVQFGIEGSSNLYDLVIGYDLTTFDLTAFFGGGGDM